MSTYLINRKIYTELELANLYFQKNPRQEAATTKRIEEWASRHFKSDVKKVAEIQPIN